MLACMGYGPVNGAAALTLANAFPPPQLFKPSGGEPMALHKPPSIVGLYRTADFQHGAKTPLWQGLPGNMSSSADSG